MHKKYVLWCALLIVSTGSCSYRNTTAFALPQESNLSPHTFERTIPVCILNDIAAHVESSLLLSLFETVSKSYTEHVGITFVQQGQIISFEHTLLADAALFNTYIVSVCPKKAEVRIVFTNGRRPALAGISHPDFGFIFIYETETRMQLTDLGENVAVISTLLHELGHLFELEHSKDVTDFMFGPSEQSYGQWTTATTQAILKNKKKKWYPNLPKSSY